MYRALYRKWRPRLFKDIIGQEAITTALENQVVADKIGHAYLFTGTRGTGKTSCAKVFAKAVNCENPAGAEPCGQCVMCKGLEDGSVLDVAEIDAASNNGVDDVRDLRDETMFRPARGRFRVYIIDEVHMLSMAAFNALLKTLEEPPSHVIFILATTEIHKVPATILSRCQRFDFMRIPAEKIAARLNFVAGEESIALSPAAADLIARLADGAMRDALSLLDTCAGVGEDVSEGLVRRMAGVADKSYLFAISGAARQGGVHRLLSLIADLRYQSIDVRRLCEELVFHYRNLLLALAQPDGSLLESVPKDDLPRYIEAAPAVGEGAAVAAVRRLASALDKMARSPDPRIELELALIDISGGDVQEMPLPRQGAALPGQASTPAGQPVPASAAAVTAGAPSSAASTAPAAQAEEVPQGQGEKAAMPPAQMVEPTCAQAPEAATPEEPLAPPSVSPAEEPAAASPTPLSGPTAATGQNAPTLLAKAHAVAEPPAPETPLPFDEWNRVLQQMAVVDRMLSSYMKGTSAWLAGNRVLISGGDLFLTYVRENAYAREKIKTVIEQVSGKRYGIGPYEAADKPAAAPTAEATLREWEQQGVAVSIE